MTTPIVKLVGKLGLKVGDMVDMSHSMVKNIYVITYIEPCSNQGHENDRGNCFVCPGLVTLECTNTNQSKYITPVCLGTRSYPYFKIKDIIKKKTFVDEAFEQLIKEI